MSNTNTYIVNNIGHWQGLEELLNTVHENQELIDNDMTDSDQFIRCIRSIHLSCKNQ